MTEVVNAKTDGQPIRHEAIPGGSSAAMTAAGEWRAHWRIVAGSAIGVATAYSSYAFVGSLFVAPLEKAFGWSRGEIAFAYNANLVGILVAPVLGMVVDRLGVRKVLLSCTALLAFVYLAFTFMGGSLRHFYGLMFLLAGIGAGTTGLSYTRAISGWFKVNRGTALAVSRTGLAASGAILPMLVYFSIGRFGWQGGYYAMAAAALFISLPAAWLWVKEPAQVSQASGRTTGKVSALRLLRDRKVLLFCVNGAFTIGPGYALLSQLSPLLTDKGLSPATAAAAIGVLSVSVFAGTIITGFLADRIWAPLIGCVFTLGPAAGCLLLLPGSPALVMVLVAIVLIGLAQGAEIDLMAYLIGQYRGMENYSAIFGILVLVTGVASSLGAVLSGWVYDQTGSYNAAVVGAAVCFAIGAVSFLALGPYPAHRGN